MPQTGSHTLRVTGCKVIEADDPVDGLERVERQSTWRADLVTTRTTLALTDLKRDAVAHEAPASAHGSVGAQYTRFEGSGDNGLYGAHQVRLQSWSARHAYWLRANCPAA